MAKKAVVISLCLFAATSAPAAFLNAQKIDEVSETGFLECVPVIQNDELRVIFIRFALSPTYTWQILEATRSSASEAFGTPSAAPFVDVLTPSSPSESPSWLSADGLRLYLTRTDGVGDTADLFVTSRTLVSEAFSAPVRLANVNNSYTDERRPILANGELSLYFGSNRNTGNLNQGVFRATRPNTTSDFGVPVALYEFGTSYSLLDVSEDELSILLSDINGHQVFLAQRSSTSGVFSVPTLVQEFTDPAGMAGASANDDFTRIYYGWSSNLSALTEADLYEADLTNGPPPTPTPSPSPTPGPPTPPLPPIDLVAGPTDILVGGTNPTNPFGGAFDSQGRFVFLDQLVMSGLGTMGNNRVLRLTPGPPASIEVLATETDLAAADSAWLTHSYGPFTTGLDVLSDDSVVLCYHTWGSAQPKIIRIVPGTTPQVSLVATISFSGYATISIAVDRSATPNTVYFTLNYTVNSISADASNGTPTTWHTLSEANTPPPTAYFGPPAIVVDRNRDVILSVGGIDNLVRIDRTTKTETRIVPGGISSAVLSTCTSVLAFALDPKNGNLFLLAGAYPGYPYPGTSSLNNLIKFTRNSDANYTAADYMIEEQVLENDDIAAIASGSPRRLTVYAQGVSAHPSQSMLYIASGSPLYYSTSSFGYQSIIGVGSETTLGARPGTWARYR